MANEIVECYLREMRFRFAAQKQLADEALAQLGDAAFTETLSAEENSVGMLMKHVGGNLYARWRDPFGGDSEGGRDRDAEFEHAPADAPATFRSTWDRGWQTAFSTFDHIGPADLLRPVVIRGETLLLIEALGRSLTHTAQHVGQIVLLARHFAGAHWRTLSVPRGQSRDFRPVRPSRPPTAG